MMLLLLIVVTGLQKAHIENADKAAYKEANNKVEHDDPHFQKYVSRWNALKNDKIRTFM